MRIAQAWLFSSVALGAIVGCGVAPTTMGKLQEASQELNQNARFGRMELAIEQVSAKRRDEWVRQHKGWGSSVRIADVETAGIRLTGEFEARVSVKIAWFRPEEQDLRVTTLAQTWKDVSGGWQLVSESKLDGDAGLLGDAPLPSELPTTRRAKAEFPTIRIGHAGDPEPFTP